MQANSDCPFACALSFIVGILRSETKVLSSLYNDTMKTNVTINLGT